MTDPTSPQAPVQDIMNDAPTHACDIANETFDDWIPDSDQDNDGAFCGAWHVEYKKNSRFALTPALQGDRPSGVAVTLHDGASWLRIWQQLPHQSDEAQADYALALSAPAKGGDGVPILKWVVLLSIDAKGQRVLHKTLVQGPIRLVPGSRIVRNFSTAGSVDGRPLLLAMDFADGPGTLAIASLSIHPRGPLPSQPALAKRPERVCVISWDMAHNPVGRAFLLADMAARNHSVELVGPIFKTYGNSIWPPIADALLPMRSFPASDMASFLRGAAEMARNTRCDIVHVGKPRLPSLLLGHLISQANNCPMIVDVDDHELAFVKDRTPADWNEVLAAAEADASGFAIPHSDLWTRFGETLLAEADYVTVSNIALQRRFGGAVLRHARDETLFDPARYDRDQTRGEFGYGAQDRVILFLGTPRAHKGLLDVAEALRRVQDPRLALCVIGRIGDKALSETLATYTDIRLALHPDQPWDRLPELVNMADAVVILQDPDHPIAAYQLPAKLTDALAMGVPVLARTVPPLEDIALARAYLPVPNDAALDAALRDVAADRIASQGQAGRTYFLTEMSYAVNAARLDLAYRAAQQARPAAKPLLDRTLKLLSRKTGIALGPSARRPPLRRDDAPRDMIFLWKQNDSDIYGRRPDMLAKYMLETGKVRRIIHLDAPIALQELEQQSEAAQQQAAHQGRQIYETVKKRVLRQADTADFLRRTFLHRGRAASGEAFGQALPPPEAYADFLRALREEAAVQDGPLLWVSPLVFDYPLVMEVLKPRLVIADLIDDQRTFPGLSAAYRQRVEEGYEAILRDADMVFSNCEPIRKVFAPLRTDIHLVPNGCERLDGDVEAHAALRDLPRPIIGYVGNLRDRVNWPLIERIAQAYPDGSIVLVGSAHGRPEVAAIAERHANIHMLGVRPYEEALQIMRGFDVAIMPHLQNALSDRMNPLKLYVYFASGLPIVASAVANIDELAPYIAVADTDDQFMAQLKAVLNGWIPPVNPALRDYLVSKMSWQARINAIWRVLEGE